MSFRLKQGLYALAALCVLVACNTYSSELLIPADDESTSEGSDTDSTLTTGGGGDGSNLTTTISTATSTSSGPNGGDGGSSGSGGGGGSGGSGGTGGDTTTSIAETTTGNDGGSGGDTSTGSTTTETQTASTNTTAGGGSGGSGGTSNTSSTTGTTIDVTLIDDLEDGNNQLETPTYTGYWFTTLNEDGEGDGITPDPDDRCDPVDLETPREGSTSAMHVTGAWGGTDLNWIAATGFALQSDKAPVDASAFAGITFFARTDDPETMAHLLVMIDKVKDEGHFAIELALTSTWTKYTVLWGDNLLNQPSWADEVMFDESTLFQLQFQFDSETFDLWIDDIRFVEE